jgi:hypothetical protein
MTIANVLKRFPKHWATICRLLETSEAARETCQRYEHALRAAPPSPAGDGSEPDSPRLRALEGAILALIEEEECRPGFLVEPQAIDDTRAEALHPSLERTAG